MKFFKLKFLISLFFFLQFTFLLQNLKHFCVIILEAWLFQSLKLEDTSAVFSSSSSPSNPFIMRLPLFACFSCLKIIRTPATIKRWWRCIELRVHFDAQCERKEKARGKERINEKQKLSGRMQETGNSKQQTRLGRDGGSEHREKQALGKVFHA